MRHIAAIVIAAMLTASLLLAQASRDSEVRFKTAQYKEEVEGDLKAALSEYKKIADGKDRALAARALIRIAAVYRRQGNAEAAKVYEEIQRKYPEQKDAVAEAQAALQALEGTAAVAALKGLSQVDIGGVWDTITPDGRYLLSRYNELRDQVTGARQRNIEATNARLVSPSIAPSSDSRRVAYAALVSTGTAPALYELRTIGLDGQTGAKPRVLLRDESFKSVAPFGWSLDDDIFVLLTRRDGGNQIGSIPAAGGSLRIVRSLSRTPGKLSLSPNGRYIAYDADSDIFVLPVVGSTEAAVLVGPARDESPIWTADSNGIVFVRKNSDSAALWLARMSEGTRSHEPELLKDDVGNIQPIGFARNGAFYYRRDPSPSDSGPFVYTAEIDLDAGTVIRPAERFVQTSSDNPVFSPDGKNLAFFVAKGRNTDRQEAVGIAVENLLQQIGTGAIRNLIQGAPSQAQAATLQQQIGGLLENQAAEVSASRHLSVRSLETGEDREIKTAAISQPAWFPDGQSVFVGSDLYFHRIDLTTGQELMKNTAKIQGITRALSAATAVSPDGKRVFYISRMLANILTAQSALMEFNVETQQQTELFKGAIPFDGSFIVSPDGSQIAIRLYPEGETGAPRVVDGTPQLPQPPALYVVPTSGGSPRKLSPTRARPIGWSSDGQRILVQSGDIIDGDVEGSLFWIPLDGSPEQRIGVSAFPIIGSLHPNRKLIAYAAIRPPERPTVWAEPNLILPNDARRWILTAQITRDGSKVTGPVTSLTQPSAVLDFAAGWSPDGKAVAFKRARPSSNAPDFVVRSDSGGQRTYATGNIGNAAGFDWFPDGKSLLVGIGSTQQSYRLDLGSGLFTEIPGLDVRPRAVSRDGRIVYFVRRNSTNQCLVVAFDLATGMKKESPIGGFFNRPGDARPPGGFAGLLRLSPNGRMLALMHFDGDWHVSILGVDGSGYKDLYAAPSLRMHGQDSNLLTWTADSRAILFGRFDSAANDARIMRIPVSGGMPTFTGLSLKGVTRGDLISVSPDGSKILFSGSPQSIYLTDSEAAR